MSDMAFLIELTVIFTSAIGFAVAFVLMLLRRPTWVRDDGTPAHIWRAFTFLMLVMVIVSYRDWSIVGDHEVRSWPGFCVRISKCVALAYVLWALSRPRERSPT